MSPVQGMRAIPLEGADGSLDVSGLWDEQDVSFALMACIFGTVARPGARGAAPANRSLQRVAPREARARKISSRLESV
jgi:hypothetical protein